MSGLLESFAGSLQGSSLSQLGDPVRRGGGLPGGLFGQHPTRRA